MDRIRARRTWRKVLFAAGAAGLLAAGPATAEDEETGWSGELAASLTAQTGTTDSVAGSADAKAQRNWERDEVSARFSALYGITRTRSENTNDQTTQNSQAIYTEWQHTLHQRFFWSSTGELSRDTIQDRAVRFAVDTGPGYRFWEGKRKKKQHFDLSAGVGYRFEIYDLDTAPGDVDRGQYDDDQFVDIVAAFEYKNLLFEDRIEYTHTGSAKVPANDANAYVLRSEVILGIPLTEAWSFRTGFLVEYVAEQPDEVTNTTTRTTIGLGYKF